MLKVVMEASAEPSGVLPLVFVVVAALALITAMLVLRYRRKGDK